jgi:hypothetical protein
MISGGALGVHAFDVGDFIGGQVGQVFAGSRCRGRPAHRPVASSMPSSASRSSAGLCVFHFLFHRQRIGQQRVAGTGAQLLDDVFVETFDRQQFGGRHIGNFLDRAETFGHQDAAISSSTSSFSMNKLARGFLLASLLAQPGPGSSR